MTPSLDVLAGSVLVAGFEGTSLPASLVERAARGALAGVIVFRRNFEGADPFATAARLLPTLASQPTGAAPLLVCIDEEGGRVRRLGAPVPQLPPARRWGELDDVASTTEAGRVLGAALHALGVNVDFAPILDVDTNPKNPIIGDRAFGADPDVVIRHALAFARGLEAAGVLSCGKHFPGHGDTDLDSHLALPRVAHDRARLDRVELPPFAAARGVIPMIMTAHVLFPELDAEVPATLSRRVIDGLLRRELGYDGVIVSDDLEMKAVADRWGVAESAVRAIEAGCDLLLVCRDVGRLEEAHAALVARAAGDETFRVRLVEAAGRVDALRARLPVPRVRSADEVRDIIAGSGAEAVLSRVPTRS